MKLVLGTILLAGLVGYMAGGRLESLFALRIRWPALALIGLMMQLAPVPAARSDLAVGLLLASFVLLFVFAAVNIRKAGFALILVGLLLNFTVIALNNGMPVTRHALVASGQQDTLKELVENGGAKHHLASAQDRLLQLGDVIVLGAPIRQAVSLGDIAAHAGVFWLIMAGMQPAWRRRRRSRPEPPHEDDPSEPTGPEAAKTAALT